MSILGKFFRRATPSLPVRSVTTKQLVTQAARVFDASDQGNLFRDWRPDYGFSFSAVRFNLAVLRSRGRAIAKNSPYGRAFINMVAQNVVYRGFQLNVLASDGDRIDRAGSHELETAFFDWSSSPEFCDAAGRKTLAMMLRSCAKGWARDGEYLIRIMDGGVHGTRNPYAFSLKVIRPDFLDHYYNLNLENGGTIACGVERDQFGRVVRYWFRKRVGLDWADTDYPTGDRYSVPADDIIHGFLEEDEDQPRGITWFHSVMRLMRMDDEYSFAEVTTARKQAAISTYYETVASADLTSGEISANGNSIEAIEPGEDNVLPQGWKANLLQATHPNGNYAAFHAEMIRSISAGLLVNFNKLGNNLEKVNYSSLRSGELSERDVWTVLQDDMLAVCARRIYRRWLRMYLVSGLTKLPTAKFQKWAAHEWHGRRWPWVDPLNDAQFHSIAEDRGWESKRSNAALLGNDLDDVLSQRERDRAAVAGKKDQLAGVGYGLEMTQTEKV